MTSISKNRKKTPDEQVNWSCTVHKLKLPYDTREAYCLLSFVITLNTVKGNLGSLGEFYFHKKLQKMIHCWLVFLQANNESFLTINLKKTNLSVGGLRK